MRHTTRDEKGKFCKNITKCLNQFNAVGKPKCSGKVCGDDKEPKTSTTFIDDTTKMPYIRGSIGDVFYILTDSLDTVMRTYKRFVIDGVKLKADKTYKLSELL